MNSNLRWLTNVGAAVFTFGALTPASAVAQRASSSAISSTRIAVFDSRVVLDSVPQRNAAESEFALEQSKARVLVSAASDSLRLALDELVQAEQRLTPREREAGKLQLRARELLVEQMIENLDGVMQQRLHELRGPLMTQLRAAVRTVRLRLQFDLVLDRASDDLIADADDRVDITQEIIRELRKSSTSPRPSERTKPATPPRGVGARL